MLHLGRNYPVIYNNISLVSARDENNIITGTVLSFTSTTISVKYENRTITLHWSPKNSSWQTNSKLEELRFARF